MKTQPKYIDNFISTDDKLGDVDCECEDLIELLGVNWQTVGAIRDTTDPAVHIDSMMLLIPFFTTWFEDSFFVLTDGDHWGMCTIHYPLREDFHDINYCVMSDLTHDEPWPFNCVQPNGLIYYGDIYAGEGAIPESRRLSIADGEKLRAIYADYMNKLNL